MTVIMIMSVPAAVLVVMALIVVVAILDVNRVAVLTVNMLSAVGRDRCRIGVYKIMRAGRIVRVDMPGRARCVILPVATTCGFAPFTGHLPAVSGCGDAVGRPGSARPGTWRR